jgi:hypothetical protein
MELIGFGIFLLVCYGLVRLAASLVGKLGGSRYRGYRMLAQRYRGKYESRGLVDPPTVSFTHQGSSIRVGLAPVVPGQPQAARTRVVARFPRGVPLRMELTPYSRLAAPQPPKGTRPVETGTPAIDRAYRILANDPAIACHLLEAEPVRGSLENLRRLAPAGGVLVSVNPERLLVQVDRNLGPNATLLDLIVRESLVLLDHVQASVADQVREGVEILGAGQGVREEAGLPECTVCGSPIEGQHVVCDRCKTPYHRDCWAFVGGCSTYGCQSKQGTAG